MQETENHSPGPRTPEGKQRSSQNAIKHGIFSKTILIAGEIREEFDRLLYHYNKDYKPKGAPEEDLVRVLVETEWRRRRLPALEARALDESLETGDMELKFMTTYGIYEQRLNRTFQLTLKTLKEAQAARMKARAQAFRVAILLYNDHKKKNLPWNPADDGFVFSPQLLERQITLYNKVIYADKTCDIKITVTDDELDLFFANDAE